MAEKKNTIVLALIIIASISLFLATLKQPETAEGVGRGWDYIVNFVEKIHE